MRFLARLKTKSVTWIWVRPALFVFGGFLLILTEPALGGRQAPAVWVPVAPGQNFQMARPLELYHPGVLVPFQDTLYIPDPNQRPAPWTPDYLNQPVASAVSGGLLPRELGRGETQGSGRQIQQVRSAPSVALSDLLRDAKWRRQTAERLRQAPSIQPRF